MTSLEFAAGLLLAWFWLGMGWWLVKDQDERQAGRGQEPISALWAVAIVLLWPVMAVLGRIFRR